MRVLFLCVMLLLAMPCMAQQWLTSFEEAQIKATDHGKTIVLVFQGSDWCGPCMKLERQIWSTHEFQNLAANDLVMVKADFPRRKKNKLSLELETQNRALAERYNPKGYFPFVVVMNSEGAVLGQLGYEKVAPIVYYNKIKAFEE